MLRWFSSKKKRTGLSWLNSYESLNFKASIKTPIDAVTFVVLDCETNGLKKTDQLITIGGIKCTSKEIYLNDSLDQKYPVVGVGKSAEIHGELMEETNSDKEILIRESLDFLSNHIIVGHNIGFDIQMINSVLNETFQLTLKNRVLDTAKLVMRLDPVYFERTVGGKSMLHLDDLCEQYDIPIENRHTALGDAYLTAQLFQRLLSKLKKRGITRVDQLMK